nr:metallophosphoesterase [Wenzhouxiangella sp. XN79A]
MQVSDCHLAADPDARYRDQSADRNLAALTPAVRAFAPDWLVLSGDLSEDASPASYARLIDWAVQFGSQVAWLPGNHDDRSVMEPLFTAAGFEAGPLVEPVGPGEGWQLVLLDSARVDDPAGRLSPDRLAPLSGVDPARPLGVFVHHQPLPVGAAWIDKVPLREPQAFWAAVETAGGADFVAFGHVHQRFRARYRGTRCLAAPSTAANSYPRTSRFTPGETTPMARGYLLADDGRWKSGLVGG